MEFHFKWFFTTFSAPQGHAAHLYSLTKVLESVRSASFIFVHLCCWEKKMTGPLHLPTSLTLLFVPSPLLAFFHRSLCPGSHYCFGKYFIDLNTFAHSHLPAASFPAHKPRINRSKWKRAKWRWQDESKGERLCSSSQSCFYLHFQSAQSLCSSSRPHHGQSMKGFPACLSSTTFCLLTFYLFCPSHLLYQSAHKRFLVRCLSDGKAVE